MAGGGGGGGGGNGLQLEKLRLNFSSCIRVSSNTLYYYSTITSFHHLRTREREKYESVLHCSKRIALQHPSLK